MSSYFLRMCIVYTKCNPQLGCCARALANTESKEIEKSWCQHITMSYTISHTHTRTHAHYGILWPPWHLTVPPAIKFILHVVPVRDTTQPMRTVYTKCTCRLGIDLILNQLKHTPFILPLFPHSFLLCASQGPILLNWSSEKLSILIHHFFSVC